MEDGHPSQLPSSRSFTAFAAGSMSTSSTSPLCAASTGRTASSARSTRASSVAGCRPCTTRRLPMSSSDGQPVDQARCELVGQLEHARETGAVEVGDLADQLLGERLRLGVGARAELVEQPLDAVAYCSEVGRWWGRGHSAPSEQQATLTRTPQDRGPAWVSEPCAAPCPCRGTCARRTAGRDRSCAPRA